MTRSARALIALVVVVVGCASTARTRDIAARPRAPACPSLRGFVAASDALVKYQVSGNLASGRPVVVFVHDWAHDSGFFYQQAAGLRSRFTILTYDLRGHGASTDDTRRGADVSGHAADLTAVLARVGSENGDRPVHLVGHGVGAWIALAAVIEQPERAASLTLISAARTWPDDVRAAYRDLVAAQRAEPTSYRDWTNKLLPVWLAEPTLESRADILAFYDFAVERLDASSAAETLGAVVDHEVSDATIAALELPVLVLYGELDEFAGRADDEAFFAAAPDVTQLRIPQAGRDAPLEAPNTVNMALARFFAAAR